MITLTFLVLCAAKSVRSESGVPPDICPMEEGFCVKVRMTTPNNQYNTVYLPACTGLTSPLAAYTLDLLVGQIDGSDQNDGLFKVNNVGGDSDEAKKKCLDHCLDFQKQSDEGLTSNKKKLTGCELIWDGINKGCFGELVWSRVVSGFVSVFGVVLMCVCVRVCVCAYVFMCACTNVCMQLTRMTSITAT